MVSDKIKEIVKQRKKVISDDIEFKKSLIRNKIYNKTRKPLSEAIRNNPEISIISEIKPASPTLGEIRTNVNVGEIAKIMENSGVVGLSILTEPNYFNGSYDNLKTAVETTKLPCLMKDFVIDNVQFYIAHLLGATNILIINSLGKNKLEELYITALKFNLEPLIEIHDIGEIKDIKQLIEVGYEPKLIGVNNRNLKTLKIDLNTSKSIIPKLKEEFGEKILVVSESGINTIDDINSIRTYQADAFLIGSSIMKSNNIKEKILSLRGVNLNS